MQISKRAKHIKPFIAMDIIEHAQQLQAQGKDIISFSLGEPDFKAPAVVTKACIRALRQDQTKYTHSQGAPELRKALVQHYRKQYGVKIVPEQIIITQGSSPAFFLVFATLLNPGDEVLLPNPHYPCDANFVSFFGGKPVLFPIYERDGYQWDIQQIKKKKTNRTKAIFVTSPSNPTGTVLQDKILQQLSRMKVAVVSDELYHGLIYEGKPRSMLEFSEDAIVVSGFSKSYAMTGFRIGYVIAPLKYIRGMQKVQQNFHISTTTFVQHAAITALTQTETDLAKMYAQFKKRREVMRKGLIKLGFNVSYLPEGAFYFFVNAKHLSANSYQLAFDILNKAHVAVTPGIDFGSRGEGYLRFSYAVSIPKIKEGLRRLEKYLEKI